MEALLDQDLYELLEVSRTGSPQQIERAYRIARVTYQPTSAATYSIFGTEQSAAILRRIEEAYAILSDTRLRREYDARLRLAAEENGAKPDPPRVVIDEPDGVVEVEPDIEVQPPVRTPPARTHVLRIRPAEPPPEIELDESLDPVDGIYDGPALRRIRMSLGIELDEISSLTKVNEPYLNSIEANEYDSLPPTVYVRGFVKEFARCLGLDPALVAKTYVERLEAQKGARG